MRFDHGHFDAAFFELFIYRLLVVLSHDVVVHPNVTGSFRRPDFLAVTKEGGLKTYVEAVIASAESSDDIIEQQMLITSVYRTTSMRSIALISFSFWPAL
jgi:hypothetical protein